MPTEPNESKKEVTPISILNLTFDTLKEIIETNTFPEGVTLEGIEKRDDYEKLFKHRNNPALIAKQLIIPPRKERSTPAEPEDFKRKRLEIRELELKARQERYSATTQTLQSIINTLRRIETGIDYLVQNLKSKKEIKNGR